jgi:hypothetical protein
MPEDKPGFIIGDLYHYVIITKLLDSIFNIIMIFMQ